jgi:hypothetical protein
MVVLVFGRGVDTWHTSHVTHYTSHVTHHTSHFNRRVSPLQSALLWNASGAMLNVYRFSRLYA